MEEVLKATGLTKRYHGNPALDGLTFYPVYVLDLSTVYYK